MEIDLHIKATVLSFAWLVLTMHPFWLFACLGLIGLFWVRSFISFFW